jgi:RTX calcium-binding nonapeptide repeat (4 copies)
MATIRGTNGFDHLEGADGDDRIFGRGGDDSLLARGGVDVLHGGQGNDQLAATDTPERGFFYGDRGDDTIYANNGTAEGGTGDDTLGNWFGDRAGTFSTWNDLTGGRGADIFFAGSYADNGIVDWCDVRDFRPAEGDVLRMLREDPRESLEWNYEPMDGTPSFAYFKELAGADGVLDNEDPSALWDGRALQVEIGGDGAIETFDGDRLVLWGHQEIADFMF